MAKQPFSPEGVKLKTAELYALSNSTLQEQSRMIATDYTGWIQTNFDLTAEQDIYFAAMDDEYLAFLSGEVSVAVGNRLPITYIITGNPSHNTGSKRFETSSTISRVIDAGVAQAATGQLIIKSVYPV